MAKKRAIPLVDLSHFTKGDAKVRQAFINKLAKAFREIGFVGVINHGIPKSLVQKFYKESEIFFALPVEKKKKYDVSGLAGQRGYTSFGKEHAKQSKVADLKNFFKSARK
jgi:isopenicillin N synthase-like dioxygenase